MDMTLAFDYPYDAFPSEINLFLKAKFKESRPYVSFLWLTPDGQSHPSRGAKRASLRALQYFP